MQDFIATVNTVPDSGGLSESEEPMQFPSRRDGESERDLPAILRNNIYFMEPLVTVFKNWSWLKQDSIFISAELFNDGMIEVKNKGKNTLA